MSTNTHRWTEPYLNSQEGQAVLRSQQFELEQTAERMREKPDDYSLDPNEAHQIADIFEAAAHVFRAKRP